MTAANARLVTLVLSGVVLAAPLSAAINSIQAELRSTLTPYRVGDGETTLQLAQETAAYPATSGTLPIQTIADLLAPDDEAAAAVGAQFADPTTLNQTNPGEFAVNLALSSVSEQYRYAGQAVIVEKREIEFSPAEVGRANGQTVDLIGTLFVDGILALFGDTAGKDLSGAEVSLRVEILTMPRTADPNTASPTQVFNGEVAISGDADGGATTLVTGDFPRDALFIANLANLTPDFETAQVAAFPVVAIDYNYQAVVGEPFELIARLTVDGANREGGTAVVCLLGTPADQLAQVITVTQGADAAKHLEALLLDERESPTGPSYAELYGETIESVGGLCAPIGFTSLLGLMALTITGARRRTRRSGAD